MVHLLKLLLAMMLGAFSLDLLMSYRLLPLRLLNVQSTLDLRLE